MPAPAEASFLLELLKYGVLLPILAVVAWFVWVQHKALRATEDARVQDLKAVNTQLIALNDKWSASVTGALSELTLMKHRHTTVLDQIRDELKEANR